MDSKWTVLIADDDPALVQALSLRCCKLGLNVVTADTGVAAILKARKAPPDLMIVDVSMPEADGFKVCDRLLALKLVFPVIVLTGKSDAETIRTCEAFGAHYVLKENDMWKRLEQLIFRLLRCYNPAGPRDNAAPVSNELFALHERAPRVLAIDDDPDITRAIRTRLKYHGVETLEATNGMQGFMMALQEAPDVIITDYRMPECDGDRLLVRLKQMPNTRSIPVIVLTGQNFDGKFDVALQRDMLGPLGASSFLVKPIQMDMLLAELERYIPLKKIEKRAAS